MELTVYLNWKIIGNEVSEAAAYLKKFSRLSVGTQCMITDSPAFSNGTTEHLILSLKRVEAHQGVAWIRSLVLALTPVKDKIDGKVLLCTDSKIESSACRDIILHRSISDTVANSYYYTLIL